MYPEVINAAGSDSEDLRAFAVREAILETLRSLRGLEPVTQSAADRALVEPGEAARAVAADEVVTATLDFRDPGVIWMSLSRISGQDESVVWNSRPFETPDRSDLSSQLADVVAGRLRRAYPRYRPLPGFPAFEVRDEDYAVFLEFQKRSLAGGLLDEVGARSIGCSDRILATFPGRLRLCRRRGAHDGPVRPCAGSPASCTTRWHRTIPGRSTSRPWSRWTRWISKKRRRGSRSSSSWRQVACGVLRARARLLEKQGALREAADYWRRLVEARPSWHHLFYLSRVTQRLGEIEESRSSRPPRAGDHAPQSRHPFQVG